MKKYAIIKTFEGKIAYAHRAENYHGEDWIGKCFFLHGHNLSYEIKASAPFNPNDECQMTIEFGKLKQIVEVYLTNVWDHSLMINTNDAVLMQYVKLQAEEYERLCITKASKYAEKFIALPPTEKQKYTKLKDLTYSDLADHYKAGIQISSPFRVNLFPFTTSIENLAHHAWEILEKPLKEIGAKLTYLKFMETPTSGFEIYCEEDEKIDPMRIKLG